MYTGSAVSALTRVTDGVAPATDEEKAKIEAQLKDEKTKAEDKPALQELIAKIDADVKAVKAWSY